MIILNVISTKGTREQKNEKWKESNSGGEEKRITEKFKIHQYIINIIIFFDN